jgi:thiosulfate dehydrogenase
MAKTLNSLLVILVILFAMLMLATCGRGEKSSTEEAEVELAGNSLRGGLLYDKWWSALELGPPEGDQPLWATQSANKRSGSDTWRCKECHGWDYKGAKGAYSSGSHFTGFVGVLDSAGKGGGYVLGALKGETNSDHDFSTVMDDQALTDLALFVTERTMDFGRFVGADKSAAGGDLAAGKSLFEKECILCHGPEGTGMNFKNQAGPEYIGGLSRGNPWEFAHKMRFGQPGMKDMPSGIDKGWTEDEQLSVLAHVQSLPNSSPVTEGGVLYDKWWAAIGAEKPEDDQPLWATQATNKRSGADTWRCKECHGWDYRGAEGAYGSGSHFTGFAGILSASSMSADRLAGWLEGSVNEKHDFSVFLEDEQVDMLVAFIQKGLVDMSPFINADKTVKGDPTSGKKSYEASCKNCHGADGKQIKFGDEDDPEYIGDIATGNPWEFFHKSSFGQPDEPMPSGVNLGLSIQDRADLLSYAQTLPTK